MSFIYSLTATWNAVGTVFNGIALDVSNGSSGTAVYAAGSKLFNLTNNTSNRFNIDPTGVATFYDTDGVQALQIKNNPAGAGHGGDGIVYFPGDTTTGQNPEWDIFGPGTNVGHSWRGKGSWFSALHGTSAQAAKFRYYENESAAAPFAIGISVPETISGGATYDIFLPNSAATRAGQILVAQDGFSQLEFATTKAAVDTTGGFWYGNNPAMAFFTTGGNNYNVVYNTIGIQSIKIGAVGLDPTNYYSQDTHSFLERGGVTPMLNMTTALFRIESTVLRHDQTPAAVGTGLKTINTGGDSSTNLSHYFTINFNGTTYYVPCGATALT